MMFRKRPRTLLGWLLSAVGILLMAGTLPVAIAPAPAQAHRDGCHAAHSCPSDTGSYVCGDTGNFSECPARLPVTPPPPPVDSTPPRQPQSQRPLTGARGLVELRLSAESGAALVVRSGEEVVVASATAIGTFQTVSFVATTGRHVYIVTATDSAGNSSQAAKVIVSSDATPPSVDRLTIVKGTPTDARSGIDAVVETGSRFTLRVDGKEVAQGVSRDGRINYLGELGNGSHDVALDLRDRVGNQLLVKRSFPVNIRALAPKLERRSDANEALQVFVLYGTPGAKAKVTVPGVAPQRLTLRDGFEQISFAVPDGDYSGALLKLVDRFGRSGRSMVESFTVDTRAPLLTAAVVAARVADGQMAFDISSEPGTQVAWTVLDEADGEVDTGDYTVALSSTTSNGEDAGDESVRFNVGEGAYEVQIIATDASGNTTATALAVAVPAAPLTPAGITVKVVSWSLPILLLLLTGWLAWRKRARLRIWLSDRRAQAVRRALIIQHAAAVKAHQVRVSRYESSVEKFHQEEQRWIAREAALKALRELARTERGLVPDESRHLKLRRGERVYTSVDGSLIDTRTHQGVSNLVEIEAGRVTVTSTRVVFTGSKNREWAFEKLLHAEHSGKDVTVMTVSNRKNASGVRYADAERTRLFIDVAHADIIGGRAQVVAACTAQLAAHEWDRPQPPEHPGPPPNPPATGAGREGSESRTPRA